jgi:acyl dehydratase
MRQNRAVTVGALETFRITATNLAEHAGNPIHTDQGAQAAGFPRALVAGVTTYAYLTHPPAAGWGLEWLRSGGGEVRFRSPVFDGEIVDCVPNAEVDGAVTVEARVAGDDRARAELRAVRAGGPCPPLRAGEVLTPRTVRLEFEWGADYGARAGDDLGLYAEHEIVHPAVWPALANHVVHAQVARGAWIHLRSVVRHHHLARAGSTATVRAVVVHRYARGGERAVLDVHVEVDGAVVASLEHEAIVALAAPH